MTRVAFDTLAILALCLPALPAKGGAVSGAYFDMAEGSAVDLTAAGTLDWIKFGNGENNTTSFLNTTKIGNPVFLPGTLVPQGTPPPGDAVDLIAFTGGGNLNFTWSDGNFGMYSGTGPVDTVVTETLSPPENSYPVGLGASFDALAISQTRDMDVYVQGFDSDMLITATMSGGGSFSTVVSPTHAPASDPGNLYSFGRVHLQYSGAGETITVSVVSQNPITAGTQNAFPNAGFFAATVVGPVPEPSTIALAACGLSLLGLAAWRKRQNG